MRLCVAEILSHAQQCARGTDEAAVGPWHEDRDYYYNNAENYHKPCSLAYHKG